MGRDWIYLRWCRTCEAKFWPTCITHDWYTRYVYLGRAIRWKYEREVGNPNARPPKAVRK